MTVKNIILSTYNEFLELSQVSEKEDAVVKVARAFTVETDLILICDYGIAIVLLIRQRARLQQPLVDVQGDFSAPQLRVCIEAG